MSKDQYELRLLPNYFKKIAWGIIISSFIFQKVAISYNLSIDWSISTKILEIGILTGLLLLMITKNKVEDELISKIRLQAFASSFIFSIICFIISSVFNLLDSEVLHITNKAFSMLFNMFFWYFITFRFMLYKR